MKPNVPRMCLVCHAKKLGEPVTAKDCLGFTECETCTKLTVNQDEAVRAWSNYLTEMHDAEGIEKVASALFVQRRGSVK